MKCEICDGAFETIQRKDEDVAEEGFFRVVEYRKCDVCLSGMIIYHTPRPKWILDSKGDKSLLLNEESLWNALSVK